MKKNINLKRIIIVVVIAILGIVYIFDPFIEQIRFYPSGLADFRDKGNYKINPETILESLDRGDINVFTPEVATPEEPIYEEPILWNQSDYLKIANTLHNFVWNEPLDDWRLYYMNFITACQDNPSGLSLGDFYYFKTVLRSNGKLRYAARELFISPQYGHVTWGGGTYFPFPLPGGWKSVNLEELNITAENALRIADENGGELARLSVQNNCKIQVRLSSYDPYWHVRITRYDNASEVFELRIDPYSGKIE